MTSLTLPPYSEILHGLLLSVKRGQAEVIRAGAINGDVPQYIHWAVNQHFSWLCVKSKDGIDRHLREPPPGLFPLTTAALRKKTELLREFGAIFDRYEFPFKDADPKTNYPAEPERFAARPWSFAQSKATRISSLVLASISSDGKKVWLEHPLSVVCKYLTVPELPATKAYSLVAIRTYLREVLLHSVEYEGSRRNRGGERSELNVRSIEAAMSVVLTSLRPRFNSKGRDTFGPGHAVDALVRHHLAMRQVLECYFESKSSALLYLDSPEPIRMGDGGASGNYQFTKSKRLEQLPSTSEVINELLGIPLPLEGAETIFCGGLRTSTTGSLIVAIHGGPGSGKTSFALAICAYLAPLGIPSLYLTAEESATDLYDRMLSVVPEQLARLSFYPKKLSDFVTFGRPGDLSPFEDSESSTAIASTENNSPKPDIGHTLLKRLKQQLEQIREQLPTPGTNTNIADSSQKPCRAVIVLDGIHDLFLEQQPPSESLTTHTPIEQLYELVSLARSLQVLVLLTTGSSLGNVSVIRLDHLVDVALHLTHNAADPIDTAQNRQITLTKARYQLCSPGTHAFNVASTRGVRIVPQTNSEIARRSIWKTQLPDKLHLRLALTRGASEKTLNSLFKGQIPAVDVKGELLDRDCDNGLAIFDRSHIFINGHGSGGKAALALKIALSYISDASPQRLLIRSRNERVLIVSFLYPAEYYTHIVRMLDVVSEKECASKLIAAQATLNEDTTSATLANRLDVLHLRPGYMKPSELYQRIDAKLTAAEISGVPYTCVILEGIHNVFLQFPEIERYRLFWAQLYSSLRTREVTTITTHATLTLPYQAYGEGGRVDDLRSEPLRQSLVQKTDYQIEVDPIAVSPYIGKDIRESLNPLKFSRYFVLKAVSTVENTPRGFLVWDRETFQISDPPTDFLKSNTQSRLF